MCAVLEPGLFQGFHMKAAVCPLSGGFRPTPCTWVAVIDALVKLSQPPVVVPSNNFSYHLIKHGDEHMNTAQRQSAYRSDCHR